MHCKTEKIPQARKHQKRASKSSLKALFITRDLPMNETAWD